MQKFCSTPECQSTAFDSVKKICKVCKKLFLMECIECGWKGTRHLSVKHQRNHYTIQSPHLIFLWLLDNVGSTSRTTDSEKTEKDTVEHVAHQEVQVAHQEVFENNGIFLFLAKYFLISFFSDKC